MIEIEEKLAQAIVNYLGTRPYAEVFQLIHGLQNSKMEKDSKVEKEKS